MTATALLTIYTAPIDTSCALPAPCLWAMFGDWGISDGCCCILTVLLAQIMRTFPGSRFGASAHAHRPLDHDPMRTGTRTGTWARGVRRGAAERKAGSRRVWGPRTGKRRVQRIRILGARQRWMIRHRQWQCRIATHGRSDGMPHTV
jgi:hypothetical protein